jgi:imidazolonepropionase-like amidohydrolase
MAKPIHIKGAKVVDAEGERSADVLVSHGKIERVGDVPAGDYDVVAAQGRYLTPGLIDCHVHLTCEAGPDITIVARRSDSELAVLAMTNAQRTLRGGVTTLRELGGTAKAEIATRDAIQRGEVQGPRIIPVGKLLTITGGHGWFLAREADSAEELVKAAREQFRAGAEFIKVVATGGVLTQGANPAAAQYTAEQLRPLVQECRRAGRKVAAHAHGEAGIAAAVEAGVASIEHGTHLTDALAAKMAEQGTFLVATTVAPVGIVEAGTAAGVPEEAVLKAEATLKVHKQALQRAVAKGVPLAMGTDAGTPFNPHGQNARELEILVEYGLKPEQALEAATTGSAKLLGLEASVGAIRPGFAADLLLLGRNPLDDVRAFRRDLQRVMKSGAWVP